LDRLAKLEADEAELLAQQSALAAASVKPAPEIPIEALLASRQQLQTTLANADLSVKRTTLRGFIDHIDIMRDGANLRGTICFYYPPPFPKAIAPDSVSVSRTSMGAQNTARCF
jgi:hypothetical protein